MAETPGAIGDVYSFASTIGGSGSLASKLRLMTQQLEDLKNFGTLYDSKTNTEITISSVGQLLVSELTRLVGGGMEGNLLDSLVWASGSTSGGTIAITGGEAALSTGTTPNGASTITTLKRGRFIAGLPNRFGGGIRLGDTGVTNNIRRWGAFDADEGLFFEFRDTEIGIVIRKGGVDNRITEFNGEGAFTLDTNYHIYNIFWSNGSALFMQDFEVIHRYVATQSQVCSTMSLKIGFENKNVSGGTSSTSLYIRGAAISRFGKDFSRPTFYHINNIAETKVLKIGTGTLHRVTINLKGSGTPLVTLYDGVDITGNIIAVINTIDAPGSFDFGIDVDVGLTFVSSVTPGDVTIIYD